MAYSKPPPQPQYHQSHQGYDNGYGQEWNYDDYGEYNSNPYEAGQRLPPGGPPPSHMANGHPAPRTFHRPQPPPVNEFAPNGYGSGQGAPEDRYAQPMRPNTADQRQQQYGYGGSAPPLQQYAHAYPSQSHSYNNSDSDRAADGRRQDRYYAAPSGHNGGAPPPPPANGYHKETRSREQFAPSSPVHSSWDNPFPVFPTKPKPGSSQGPGPSPHNVAAPAGYARPSTSNDQYSHQQSQNSFDFGWENSTPQYPPTQAPVVQASQNNYTNPIPTSAPRDERWQDPHEQYQQAPTNLHEPTPVSGYYGGGQSFSLPERPGTAPINSFRPSAYQGEAGMRPDTRPYAHHAHPGPHYGEEEMPKFENSPGAQRPGQARMTLHAEERPMASPIRGAFEMPVESRQPLQNFGQQQQMNGNAPRMSSEHNHPYGPQRGHPPQNFGQQQQMNRDGPRMSSENGHSYGPPRGQEPYRMPIQRQDTGNTYFSDPGFASQPGSMPHPQGDYFSAVPSGPAGYSHQPPPGQYGGRDADPRVRRDPRGPRPPQRMLQGGPNGYGPPQDSRDPRDPRVAREAGDPRRPRDPRDARDPRGRRDMRGPREPREGGPGGPPRDPRRGPPPNQGPPRDARSRSRPRGPPGAPSNGPPPPRSQSRGHPGASGRPPMGLDTSQRQQSYGPGAEQQPRENQGAARNGRPGDGPAPAKAPGQGPTTPQAPKPVGGPGTGPPDNAKSGDALPYHPTPVRPGHMQNGSSLSNGGAAASVQANNRSSGEGAKEPPVTLAELDSLRASVRARPQDQDLQMKLVKKLIEASSVLASEGGRADVRTTAKNKERFVQEAHKTLKKLASGEHAEAQFFLADAMGTGVLGIPNDPKEAFQLYQSAAKLRHAQAAYRTAICCEIGPEEGGGTRRDPVKAVQWYKRAANLGDVGGMYKSGMICLEGLLGSEKNPAEGVAWLQRAAEKADADHPHALHKLGQLHENPTMLGIAVPVRKDDAQALRLFGEAGQFGYKLSQFKLGQAHEYGSLGAPIDARQSIIWYTKAASQGEHQSELALSGWYLTGADGILEHSDTEAYLWARKAATSDPPLPKALFALGYYTEVGIGCPRSLEEAKKWYGRAAAYKFPKAQERLEELRRGGVTVQKNREKLSRNNQRQTEESCAVM